MRAIFAVFAGFAAVPILLWGVIAVLAMLSPLTRDFFTLGAWLIAALILSGIILVAGLFVAGVVDLSARADSKDNRRQGS